MTVCASCPSWTLKQHFLHFFGNFIFVKVCDNILQCCICKVLYILYILYNLLHFVIFACFRCVSHRSPFSCWRNEGADHSISVIPSEARNLVVEELGCWGRDSSPGPSCCSGQAQNDQFGCRWLVSLLPHYAPSPCPRIESRGVGSLLRGGKGFSCTVGLRYENPIYHSLGCLV